ncbi:hypothetical protein LZ31DRAFT_293139 [Colletotrichum somersetense]|nr:hypothetical protein LZ31DRAFT_293139 [Colletotrichum somersetense]
MPAGPSRLCSVAHSLSRTHSFRSRLGPSPISSHSHPSTHSASLLSQTWTVVVVLSPFNLAANHRPQDKLGKEPSSPLSDLNYSTSICIPHIDRYTHTHTHTHTRMHLSHSLTLCRQRTTRTPAPFHWQQTPISYIASRLSELSMLMARPIFA